MQNTFRISQMFVSWLSLLYLPRKSFHKFLPVSLVASLLVIQMCILAIPYKWWVVRGGVINKLFNDLSFIYGAFFAGTLWVFHLTFGNLKRYFFMNLMMALMFAYPINYVFQRMKLYRLINFKPWHIVITFLGFSMIIYMFQLLFEHRR